MHKPLSRGHFLPLVLIVLLAACARSPVLPPETSRLPERVELSSVPFFPQSAYQCGPAALATMLAQRGLTTSPGLLKDQVFIPGREGSLQVEMVAAARSHDMLVYPLQPRLEAVLAEVAAGNPVLVLQNLAFDWYPRWHFAVVVGYDRRERTLILRSGTTARWLTDFTTFDRTWARGGRWAVLTLPADQLPAQAELRPWLKAASDLEETGHVAVAQRAYRKATEHWPDESLSWFALANGRYAAGDVPGAEAALRRSLAQQADFAVGWFNLSEVLGERGCQLQAERARSCAQRLAPADSRFQVKAVVASSTGRCAALPACPAAE
ncbi:PA2778 family cysteine peptidase [Pseudomonas zhanjiangensis]|uniref:PA2778 family cysteine peptidase n=1 Tax=Pseudomonas zhanjiangensis TaxID=3239015 RepID=A0ABV3YYU0_9PSED